MPCVILSLCCCRSSFQGSIICILKSRLQDISFLHECFFLPLFCLLYALLCTCETLSFQIKCMELKKADHISSSDKGSTAKEGEFMDVHSGFCSSVEIKDAYIPPWIISSICAVMGSEGKSFEARYGKTLNITIF